MPFRTPKGTHYHNRYGCSGATVPCSTRELAPCSFCCEDSNFEAFGAPIVIWNDLNSEEEAMLHHLEETGYKLDIQLEWVHQEIPNIFDEEQKRIEELIQIANRIERSEQLFVAGTQTFHDAPVCSFDEFLDSFRHENERYDTPTLLNNLPEIPLNTIPVAKTFSNVRQLATNLPKYHIDSHDTATIRQIKDATKHSIDAIMEHFSVSAIEYQRCMQAIEDLQLVSQARLNCIEYILTDPDIAKKSEQELQEYCIEKKLDKGRRGCYIGDHGHNAIYMLGTLPNQDEKGQLSDVILHEAIHALSTHWDEDKQDFVSGFGNEPPVREALNDGFTELMRRFGTGVQRGATDDKWSAWAYSSNYLTAKIIADVVGEQKAVQHFLNGAYTELEQEFNQATNGVVSLNQLCDALEQERKGIANLCATLKDFNRANERSQEFERKRARKREQAHQKEPIIEENLISEENSALEALYVHGRRLVVRAGVHQQAVSTLTETISQIRGSIRTD